MHDYETTFDIDRMAMVTHKPSIEKVAADIASHIARDYDGKVHAALVGLGWTPPHDNRDVTDAVHRAEAAVGMWCIRDLDGGLEGSGVPEMLAAEIRRLRVLFRVNMLRLAPQTSHAEIDKILYPVLPEMTE